MILTRFEMHFGLAFREAKDWIFTDPKTSSQVPIGTVGITF